MLLETLITASIEVSLGLLAEAGLGDELTNLFAGWRNSDARKRRAALEDALDRAYGAIQNPTEAETLRSWANHRSIRDEISSKLLDPEHRLNIQSIADEMIERFPFDPLLVRRFFRYLNVALLDDEIWGPPLERLQLYREREDEQEAVAIKGLALPASALVEKLDAELVKVEEGLEGDNPKRLDPDLSQHVQNFIETQILVHVEGERGIAIRGDMEYSINASGDNNSITQIINTYAGSDSEQDDEQLRKQIADYLKWVRARYGTIELRGVHREGQQVVQLDLETVYVPLSAQAVATRDGRDARHHSGIEEWELLADFVDADGQVSGGFRSINLSEILDVGDRLIVTGGPGSGKTTVLQHIAWTLATAIGADRPEIAGEVLGLKFDESSQASEEATPLLPLPIFMPLSALCSAGDNYMLKVIPKSASWLILLAPI